MELFTGDVYGRVVESRGENGWGFDPIFIPDGHDMTWAQMSREEKYATSHRGKALGKFKKYLVTNDLI